MKKFIKIGLILLIAGVVGGYVFWTYHKNKIVKESISTAIAKETDSLYYLHYDSSYIDEINGNATFYNVILQSDSSQKKWLLSSDSLPNVLYNIRVNQVQAKGIDIAGLLQKENVAAGKILLIKPVVQIINTGSGQPKPYTIKDTLELYKKILGRFKSIQADTIQVLGGTLIITNKTGKAQTTLENINIMLNDFLVDSTKDYHHIVSYFIKDVRVNIENIQLPAAKNNTRINLENVEYNALKRYLHISSLKQYPIQDMQPLISLRNIEVNKLNTNAFILQRRLKAGQVKSDGGDVTIYLTKKAKAAEGQEKQTIELSSEIIDQAQIDGIVLGRTRVVIIDKTQPGKTPFVLTNTRFTVSKMQKIKEGTSIANLIKFSAWELSADGFSFLSKDKLYTISLGDFVINNAGSLVKIKNLMMKPRMSEQQFVKMSHEQRDQYNLTVNNIQLSGVNFPRLIDEGILEVASARIQPILKIFNDRTLPPGKESKLGKYPHQSILKLPFPIDIYAIEVYNGSISYRERAAKSGLTGNVFFSDINAKMENITNLPGRIKEGALLKLKASAKFLGVAKLETQWQFPLKANNGSFRIQGKLTQMDATSLNPIIEPLAMASAKEGVIDQVSFTIDGTDTRAIGKVLVLYKDLKMNVLKKDNESDSSLSKKGLVSFIANTLIKNDNEDIGNIREIHYKRDITRSFFNLIWKTIFSAAKSTSLGKKDKIETVEPN